MHFMPRSGAYYVWEMQKYIGEFNSLRNGCILSCPVDEVIIYVSLEDRGQRQGWQGLPVSDSRRYTATEFIE